MSREAMMDAMADHFAEMALEAFHDGDFDDNIVQSILDGDFDEIVLERALEILGMLQELKDELRDDE